MIVDYLLLTVWCERKILFQLIIYDCIRASEQGVHIRTSELAVYWHKQALVYEQANWLCIGASKHAVVMFNFLIFTGKQDCQMLMSRSLAGFMDACLHYRPSELYGRLGIVWIDNRISMRHEIYERI